MPLAPNVSFLNVFPFFVCVCMCAWLLLNLLALNCTFCVASITTEDARDFFLSSTFVSVLSLYFCLSHSFYVAWHVDLYSALLRMLLFI